MFSLNTSPIAFSIGTIDVYWYGILFAISLLIVWYIANNILNKLSIFKISPMNINSFDSFLLWGIIITIISARLGHILFYDLKFYINDPAEIFMLRHGGLAFHGGLIGMGTYIYIYCKKKYIPWLFLTDLLSISTSAGLITGRLANFFNQELCGKIWISEWGVVFPLIDTFPRYPTQLYEAATEGVLAFVIQTIYLNKTGFKSFGSGMYSALFCIVYSISRFIIEFYKDVEQIFMGLTTGQILCIFMFIFGLYIHSRYKSKI